MSFEEIARAFFRSHNPCREAYSIQYRSAAFPRSSEQRAVYEQLAREAAERAGRPVETDIEDFTGFTLAEDYHQKYRLRFVRKALAEYEALFPTTEAFLGSVAVTRANAIAAGYGTTLELRDGLGDLGLSEAAQESLARSAR